MKRLALSLIGCLISLPTTSHSSGFYVPNQSSAAIALSGAHIAFTPGADASFYNPANMSWQKNTLMLEGDLTTIILPSINYEDARSSLLNGNSESEVTLLPQLFAVSRDYKGLRFGFSLTCPFGLSKRWQQPFPRASSEEFSLKVIEATPALSWKISDMVSIGGGLRVIYGKGKAVSTANNPPISSIAPLTTLSRDLDGDTMELGYNLALSFKATKNLLLAATYRSAVDLGLTGDATLNATIGPALVANYTGGGSVDITAPAIISLATAYTYKKLTTEIVWERVQWSSFDSLDFQYDLPLSAPPFNVFDQPIPKNWQDTDAIKFGITYRWSDAFGTSMGISFDESPIPTQTLGFELPGSDSVSYSGGLTYQLNGHLQVAFSYLYHHSNSREVFNLDSNAQPNISGTFSDGGAHLLNTGFSYEF